MAALIASSIVSDDRSELSVAEGGRSWACACPVSATRAPKFNVASSSRSRSALASCLTVTWRRLRSKSSRRIGAPSNAMRMRRSSEGQSIFGTSRTAFSKASREAVGIARIGNPVAGTDTSQPCYEARKLADWQPQVSRLEFFYPLGWRASIDAMAVGASLAFIKVDILQVARDRLGNLRDAHGGCLAGTPSRTRLPARARRSPEAWCSSASAPSSCTST